MITILYILVNTQNPVAELHGFPKRTVLQYRPQAPDLTVRFEELDATDGPLELRENGDLDFVDYVVVFAQALNVIEEALETPI